MFEQLPDFCGSQYPDFVRDLVNIEALLGQIKSNVHALVSQQHTAFFATDSVDPEAYFQMGAYPVESCQHFDSSGDNNKALLSHVADAQIRIIRVYTNDVWSTRVVLRLLTDSEGNPALFAERHYPTVTSVETRDLVLQALLEKAKRMEVIAYSAQPEMGSGRMGIAGIRDLFGKKGRTPYVYSDAGDGRIPGAELRIRNALPVG